MNKHKSGAVMRKLKKERDVRDKKGHKFLESLGFKITSEIENKGEVNDEEFHNQNDFSGPSYSKQNVKCYTNQNILANAAESTSSNTVELGNSSSLYTDEQFEEEMSDSSDSVRETEHSKAFDVAIIKQRLSLSEIQSSVACGLPSNPAMFPHDNTGKSFPSKIFQRYLQN